MFGSNLLNDPTPGNERLQRNMYDEIGCFPLSEESAFDASVIIDKIFRRKWNLISPGFV